ncbi:MAG: ribonuclease J [Intestinibacter sp.]|uniref:ribonuclease J n=1 Tax=Intestinibacter sp. TaxID=1965304 RepID=UPI002A81928F|nr:ribonuclease J [Intestinibacter sp.]MDY4575455.1 ribonuclease J [Intestinibacter sp.]
MKRDTLKIIPLGGLGEIGKNITAIEYEDEIIVIDCGVSFPDDDMLGIDLVIPDITYLLENKDKIKGLFITHGHEDHIGSIPYILRQLNMDIYATRLTIGLIACKLEEHKIIDTANLIPVKEGDVVNFNKLSVEFIRATHSIADSCSLAIFTPLGTVVHTGDFKIDYTPIDGRVMDLNRFSELGENGILLLMADSTNVDRSGHSLSERTIGETLNRILNNAKGRVIVATFASNIHRIQQIVDASLRENRKICFSGRSMENVSNVAMELGYLHIPEESLIDLDEIDSYGSKITIITTGSQGEPMAGLSRIAYGTHKKITLEPDDLFIISASPIPGNGKMISKVINQLYKKGAEVIYEDLEDVHVSGHAYQEELKLIHSITKPKYFMPVHGEYRHLKHHEDLAKKMGMKGENIFKLETGDVLEITKDKAVVGEKVRTGVLYVDGIGVGDVGNIVLRDRRNLARDGMVIIVFAIDKDNFYLASGPDVITRGFIYARENENLINEIKEISRQKIEECLDDKSTQWQILKTSVRKAVELLLFEKTKRRPSVFPIIMDV